MRRVDVAGTLRRRLLTPSRSAATFAVRGFPEKSPDSRKLLETVGMTFLTGYGHAAACSRVDEADARLAGVRHEFRGFAYEGAAMAFAVRDGLPFGHTHHVADFLAGPADRHIYMVYVGLGWSLARLPRFWWRAATAAANDPLLRWLMLDGYGFHQGYFHTERYVRRQFTDTAFRWPSDDPSPYAHRVVDQGIGRALWFVTGADPDLLAATIDLFAPERRSDLYSGAGLAATYAGGVDEAELRTLVKHAGPYRPSIAQGSAFAAEARSRAGLVVGHTELATSVLCGMSVQEAAAVTDRARPDGDGEAPAYEIWRRRIADELATD